MTLVGKIFTVLIFIMSVAFLMLAVTVFATHRNWRDAVMRPREHADGPGLKIQIEDLHRRVGQLKEQLVRVEDRLAIEQAARRYALAALQTKLTQAEGQAQRSERAFAEEQAKSGVLATTLEANEDRLAAITAENEKLRESKRVAEQARDEKHGRVVELTDNINELTGTLDDMTEREKQLLAQVSRQKVVLDRHGLDEFTPVVDIPPRVDGYVTAVGETDLVEISIGSDDGLREGHRLEVFRNNSYLGRVEVKRTHPDRAVAEILKEYRQGIIKKGDRVATKLS
jgi:hypothetical protein